MPDPAQLRSIRRNAGHTFLRQAAALPFTLALGAVASRLLLPAGYGAFTLATLAVTLVANIVGNGVAVGLIREIGNDPAAARKLTRQAVVVAAATGLLLAPLVGAGSIVILGAGHRLAALAAVALPAAQIAAASSGCLAACGEIRRWNRLQLIAAPLLVAGVAAAAFFPAHDRLVAAVCGWATAETLVAVLWLATVHPIVRPWRGEALRTGRGRAVGKLAVGSGLATVVAQLNYRIDMLVLQAFRGTREVGLYAVAVMLAELVWLASSAFNTPSVEPVISAGDDRDAARLACFGSRLSFLFAAGLAILLGVAAPFAVPLIFGHDFAGAVGPLLILLPAVVVYSYAKVLAVYVTMRNGDTRMPLIVGVASCTTTLALSVPLCWQLGATGAAIASSSGYLVGILIFCRSFLRMSGLSVRELQPRPQDVRG